MATQHSGPNGYATHWSKRARLGAATDITLSAQRRHHQQVIMQFLLFKVSTNNKMWQNGNSSRRLSIEMLFSIRQVIQQSRECQVFHEMMGGADS
jgi:hypothetical protein